MSDATSESGQSPSSPDNNRAWYRRIGPGLITACVVIGPGSILTSSKIGANEQYAMLWVVAVFAVLTSVFAIARATIAKRTGLIDVQGSGGQKGPFYCHVIQDVMLITE